MSRPLIKPFPYLPALKKAILVARPRPEIANANHLRLAISSAVHQALAIGQPAAATIAALPD